jgi:hypothetical protein
MFKRNTTKKDEIMDKTEELVESKNDYLNKMEELKAIESEFLELNAL